MHNNYYVLRQLASELDSRLKETVVSECFSQHKDELIIRFEASTQPFFIKASVLPDFCCLSFPENFNRARKNSVDLFPQLIGLRVRGVNTYSNERCFSIEFNENFLLLFKMHGNRANLVLFDHQTAVSLFRNHLQNDLAITLQELNKEIDWSDEAFCKNAQNLKALYFTFGKLVWRYLETNHFNTKSLTEQRIAIQEVLKMLETPVYYVTESEGRLLLSLLPLGNIQATYATAVEALHHFFLHYSIQTGFLKEKQSARSTLLIRLKNTQNYLAKARHKLLEIESEDQYRLWADLIMANLHRVKTGMDKITLPDFLHDQQPVTVKLKKELSAQKNAEVYYRKSKNHHLEVNKLKESIARKEQEEIKLNHAIEHVSNAPDLTTLRQISSHSAPNNSVAQSTTATLPYHEVEFQGYKIWIGKNARNNDVLTLKYTYKDDLWLHAKDVAGSHVVIKHQAGKKISKEVIERAAQLAAYHSKRKHESLCPVTVTTKKFVRKRKGDPPGTVIVEREEVIMVEPIA